MLDELQAGARTYNAIYGESGEDWREQFRQRAIEEKETDMLAKEFGIDRNRIASFAQQSLSGIAPGAEDLAGAQQKGGGKEQKS